MRESELGIVVYTFNSITQHSWRQEDLYELKVSLVSTMRTTVAKSCLKNKENKIKQPEGGKEKKRERENEYADTLSSKDDSQKLHPDARY